MPIRPENRARYPKDWPQISQRIRFGRAKGLCECHGECGRGLRNGKPKHDGRCDARHGEPHPRTGSLVVLTTAHLNDPIEDCSETNLKAMCQACHLAYDMDRHQANRRESRRKLFATAELEL
jgi:hypothetical protein